MRRFTFFISIFVFFLSLASQRLNRTTLSCDGAQPEVIDCHCPMHSPHCCGSLAIIGKLQRTFALTVGMHTQFSRESRILKPAPFLDGPFQPPRASFNL